MVDFIRTYFQDPANQHDSTEPLVKWDDYGRPSISKHFVKEMLKDETWLKLMYKECCLKEKYVKEDVEINNE